MWKLVFLLTLLVLTHTYLIHNTLETPSLNPIPSPQTKPTLAQLQPLFLPGRSLQQLQLSSRQQSLNHHLFDAIRYFQLK